MKTVSYVSTNGGGYLHKSKKGTRMLSSIWLEGVVQEYSTKTIMWPYDFIGRPQATSSTKSTIQQYPGG